MLLIRNVADAADEEKDEGGEGGTQRGRDILATLIDPESHIDFHNFSYEKETETERDWQGVVEQAGSAGWVI